MVNIEHHILCASCICPPKFIISGTVDAAYCGQTHIADKAARDGILPNKIRWIMWTSAVYYGQSSGIPGSRLINHND